MEKTGNTKQETLQRLQEALRGAFSGPPTPLKDILTRDGESRAVKVVAKSQPQHRKKKVAKIKKRKKKSPPKRG